eukprot:363250-Chlamydomonas_euryale.AAC.8
MAGRFHIGCAAWAACIACMGGSDTEVCVVQAVGMIFSYAQSSAPVSVTVHPTRGHSLPFTVHSNPGTYGIYGMPSERMYGCPYALTDGCGTAAGGPTRCGPMLRPSPNSTRVGAP